MKRTGVGHGWLMKGGELVGNLLSPALSSTSVWRRGKRRAVLPFMSQPWAWGDFGNLSHKGIFFTLIYLDLP
jgi:hypothetical protein